MRTFTHDPMGAVRPQAEALGFRLRRSGKRWALIYGEHVILRRREYRRFLRSTRVALDYFDALTN